MQPRAQKLIPFDQAQTVYPGHRTAEEWFNNLPNPDTDNNTSLEIVRSAIITATMADIARINGVFNDDPAAYNRDGEKIREYTVEDDESSNNLTKYKLLANMYKKADRELQTGGITQETASDIYFLESTLRSGNMQNLMDWDEEIHHRLMQVIPQTEMLQIDRVMKLMGGGHLAATLTLYGQPFYFDRTVRCIGKSYNNIKEQCDDEGVYLLPDPRGRLGSKGNKGYEHRGIERTTGKGLQPVLPNQLAGGEPRRYGVYLYEADPTAKTVPYLNEDGLIRRTDRTQGLPDVGALCIAPLLDYEKKRK